VAGTVPLPDRVPVPLQQLNLKVPPAVLEHWRAQAKAQGMSSVRDRLVSIAGPAAEPGAGSDLADRVTRLEAELARLMAPPPKRLAPIPQTGDAVPADGIETAVLANRLGIKNGALHARMARRGGARACLVIDGWRCVAIRPPASGGPPRAVWVPATD
jgi:hypothetical protein